jgi:N-acyl homoserine lactone hydrolase
MTIELFAFECGRFQAPAPFYGKTDAQDYVKAPVPAWLIRHPDKGLAIFDTGLGHRFLMEANARLADDAIGFEFHESDELAVRLKAAHINPACVNWVINSHLHADHCGGNASFPNATIVVQRREWEVARDNPDGKSYHAPDFDLGQPVLAIDGEHDLFGDGSLVLFPTFGHTPGHQSARVRLASGEVILTADCCYMQYNLDHLSVPSINKDVPASTEVLRTLRGLRDRGTRILFGHDPVQWQQVPQGRAIR